MAERDPRNPYGGTSRPRTNNSREAEIENIKKIRQQEINRSRMIAAISPSRQVFDSGIKDPIATRTDARKQAEEILKQFDLESLVPELTNYLLSFKGAVATIDGEAVKKWIRSTPAYAKRFAGNVAREKSGLPKLEEVVYIAQERAYRKQLQGLVPKSFYDNYRDFQRFIVADIDPTEVGQRARMAYDLSQKTNPEYRKALKDFYGIGDKEITAYFLDPKKALPLLQSRQSTIEIGGEALQSNLTIGRSYAEQLAAEGYDGRNVQPAMVEAGEAQGITGLLGQVSGINVLDRDILDESLNRQGQGARTVRQLRSQQRARFGGSSAGTRILGSDEAGSF